MRIKHREFVKMPYASATEADGELLTCQLVNFCQAALKPVLEYK